MSEQLTSGESLWLWRQQQGITQRQAAKRLKVGRTRLVSLEQATEPCDASTKLPCAAKPLEAKDLIRLARRRSRLTLREAAEKYNVSHTYYLRLEEAGDIALLAMWKKAGFIG